MRRIAVLLGLLFASRPALACDDAPTGVERERVWLHFKMPAGLMPDDQFDGLPAKLEVHHVKPVYAHGKCPSVPTQVAVLVHGRSVDGFATFDLATPGLSVQEALALQGIESFAPNLLGYGKSTRFDSGLNDPCNASLPGLQNGVCPTPDVGCDFSPVPGTFPLNVQGTYLAVNPLAGELCAHSSKKRFATSDVWARDIHQVIDHAIASAQPTDGKVVLVGYSLGGPRAGWALAKLGADAPAKISRAVFAATLFGPPLVLENATSQPPGGYYTYPLNIDRKLTSLGGSKRPPDEDALVCPGRVVPGAAAQTWTQIMEGDTIGRSWGGTDPDHPEGVNRTPTFNTYGWTKNVAPSINVPVLIMHGLDDSVVVPATASCDLYKSLPAALPKILVQVACGGHSFLVEGCSGARCQGGAAYGAGPDGVWGGPHATVQTALVEWIKHGTFAGQTGGRYVVDVNGVAAAGTTCPP